MLEQNLWAKETAFWAEGTSRIDERATVQDGAVAVLSYRVNDRSRALRCRSTYARACGSWMLVEHRQSPI